MSERVRELEAEVESLKAALADMRNRTRQLDPNQDDMLLFLESAKKMGFVIQLVPPKPVQTR
jgi:hypothetical protein